MFKLTIQLIALLLALATLASAQGGPMIPAQSPCNYTKCGYGAQCQVVDGRAKCVCPDVCPQYFMAICGSDGRTYGNTCFMNVAACNQKKSIVKVSDGECPKAGQTTVKPLPTVISPGIGLPKPGKGC